MKPIEIALVVTAVAALAVGGAVFYMRRKDATKPPVAPPPPPSSAQEQARAKTVENIEKAARDAAGKGGDVVSNIVNTFNDVKGLIDGFGATFNQLGALFQ